MFQRVCDRCGKILKEPLIQFGNKNEKWKGPETNFKIYGPDEPYEKQQGHLCDYCTERFVDWITEGVINDEPKD